MDAFNTFNTQNQIFASHCEDANRVFQDFVNDQLVRNTQAGTGSMCQEDDSVFDAKYSAAKAEIARIRAEMEAGF